MTTLIYQQRQQENKCYSINKSMDTFVKEIAFSQLAQQL